jgi:hypothetical protein
MTDKMKKDNNVSENQAQCAIQKVNNSADKYLDENIVDARTDHDKACELYRNYVGKAETFEERKRRINRFRCGGW